MTGIRLFPDGLDTSFQNPFEGDLQEIKLPQDLSFHLRGCCCLKHLTKVHITRGRALLNLQHVEVGGTATRRGLLFLHIE